MAENLGKQKKKKVYRCKIKCLECNATMDSDYRLKHDKSYHVDLVKKNKSVRYEKLNAPNLYLILKRSN